MSQEADHNYLCDTGLALGLSIGGSAAETKPVGSNHPRKDNNPLTVEPSLSLSLADDTEQKAVVRGPPSSPPHSAVSSFSVVKREDAAAAGDQETEAERNISSPTRASLEDDEDGSTARKKLRLTREQSALLEDRFKEHSTLNPKQKLALAKQLNLRPRQVEVWFQNRRARTKLKQTEVDCEFLKRCCETLTEENRRLQRELQELKFAPPTGSVVVPPFYMQLPAATLTICPSCDRVGGTAAASNTADRTKAGPGPFGVARPAAKSHFFNPFTHSATC